MSEETMEKMEIVKRLIEADVPLSSVEITHGQRGGYGWTVKVYDKVVGVATDKAVEIDRRLKGEFGEVKAL